MSKEDFKDLKEFGESVGLKESYEEAMDSPYALLIEDVDDQKDRDRVYRVLSESGIDLDLELLKNQLQQGYVLVSHINEATAAMIVDQIKDIEADIRFGLLSKLSPLKPK